MDTCDGYARWIPAMDTPDGYLRWVRAMDTPDGYLRWGTSEMIAPRRLHQRVGQEPGTFVLPEKSTDIHRR